MLKDFATTVRDDVFAHLLHCQCVDYCCTQHGSIFEWKLETWFVLSCKQTHPVKCSRDPRKDKNAMDGFGDYWGDERHANSQPRFHRILGWNTDRAYGFQTWQTGAMSVCA